VTREVSAAEPCNPTALVESILDIIPLQILWGKVLCEWVASGCTMLLKFPRWKFPGNGISGGMTRLCLNVFREKEKFLCMVQEENLRGIYCNLPPL